MERRGGEEADHSGATLKGDTGTLEFFQPWCATDEFDEFRCAGLDLIEEAYEERAESRGIDLSHKILKVCANPFELQRCKNGEDTACRGRRTSAVRARSRGLKMKAK